MGWWTDISENPHVIGALHGLGEVTSPRTDIPFTRRLQWDAPRAVYRDDRPQENKTTVHWGQRKLLMSEIEFLTRFSSKARVVLYVGAAPCTHLKVLLELFEDHLFVLVDPAPFNVRESEHVRIIPECFTDELARKITEEYGNSILFISDMRSSGLIADGHAVHEEAVQRDMMAQQRWHLMMRPVKSMLKFRLPFVEGSTVYLDGEMMLPVWGPVCTTECRLIVDRNALVVEYNHKQHEERMYHFNTVTRFGLYEHDVRGEGIDHCYDCRSEIHVLRAYLLKNGCPRRRLACCVSMLSKHISRLLSKQRTLESPNPETPIGIARALSTI